MAAITIAINDFLTEILLCGKSERNYIGNRSPCQCAVRRPGGYNRGMQWTLKRIVSLGIWVLFVACLIAYAVYQSRAVREGPQLTIDSPASGITVSEPLLRVRGTAVQAKELYLNGRGIFVDLRGHFDEELLLLPGYNIIELTAKDTGGHEARQTIEIAFIRGDSTAPIAGPTSTPERTASTSSAVTN